MMIGISQGRGSAPRLVARPAAGPAPRDARPSCVGERGSRAVLDRIRDELQQGRVALVKPLDASWPGRQREGGEVFRRAA